MQKPTQQRRQNTAKQKKNLKNRSLQIQQRQRKHRRQSEEKASDYLEKTKSRTCNNLPAPGPPSYSRRAVGTGGSCNWSRVGSAGRTLGSSGKVDWDRESAGRSPAWHHSACIFELLSLSRLGWMPRCHLETDSSGDLRRHGLGPWWAHG